MVQGLINANPVAYERKKRRPVVLADVDEYTTDPIDQLEVFNHIRDIRDPELPNSLEELKVVTEDAVEVDDKNSHVSLPSRYKVDIRVAPGTHAHEALVNKRVNDKERVAGALELPGLVKMVDHCLAPTYERIGKENVYDL